MTNQPHNCSPEFLLSDFYQLGWVLNSRDSFQNFGWIPADIVGSDFRTGGALSVNGTLPVICSSAVCGARTHRIFRAAGLPENSHTLNYDCESDYEAILEDCHRQKKSVIFQHQHRREERLDELYWIDPDLLGRLNNKACLSEFVPEEYLPQRQVLSVKELSNFLSAPLTGPLVLKGAANMPSGGGNAVAIVRTIEDLQNARERLEMGEQFVVEECLSIEDNYCVNYATDGQQIVLLGSSDQISDESGGYQGNWLSLNDQPPQEVIEVGFEIMQRAVDRGYCGVAGFDIVRERGGRILVIDLNFRLNGSTAAVMWKHRLLSRQGSKSVGRIVSWNFSELVDPDLSLVTQLVESGWFFPLAIYDPQASSDRCNDVRVRGILFGSSRWEVEQRLEKIQRKFGNFTPSFLLISDANDDPPDSRRAA